MGLINFRICRISINFAVAIYIKAKNSIPEYKYVNQSRPSSLARQESEEALAQEQKTARTQKILMWVIIAASAIIILILIYIFAIRQPGIQAADNAIGQADMSNNLGQDSVAPVQYKQVADNYGYDAGNRAALNAAIILYQQAQNDSTGRAAKLEEAISYLKKYDAKESVIGASSRSLMGDCYVNLGNLQEGRKCFCRSCRSLRQ